MNISFENIHLIAVCLITSAYFVSKLKLIFVTGLRGVIVNTRVFLLSCCLSHRVYCMNYNREYMSSNYNEVVIIYSTKVRTREGPITRIYQ